MNVGTVLKLFVVLDVVLIVAAITYGWRWTRLRAVRRFFAATRREWKRVVVGAAAGWFVGTSVGAFGIVFLEQHTSAGRLETINLSAVALVWASVGLGALAGYATRRTETQPDK